MKRITYKQYKKALLDQVEAWIKFIDLSPDCVEHEFNSARRKLIDATCRAMAIKTIYKNQEQPWEE